MCPVLASCFLRIEPAVSVAPSIFRLFAFFFSHCFRVDERSSDSYIGRDGFLCSFFSVKSLKRFNNDIIHEVHAYILMNL